MIAWGLESMDITKWWVSRPLLQPHSVVAFLWFFLPSVLYSVNEKTFKVGLCHVTDLDTEDDSISIAILFLTVSRGVHLVMKPLYIYSWRCLLIVVLDNDTPTSSRVVLTWLDVVKDILHQVKNLPEDGLGYMQRPDVYNQTHSWGWESWQPGWEFTAEQLFYVTWKRRMMVQMRPRVRRWFPSTISCEPMFSRWTFCSLRNCRALSTFSRQWIRMRPLVGFGCVKQRKNTEDLGLLITKNMKKKRGREEREITFRHDFSFPWLMVQGKGHADGLGQVWEREGWFLCDTDQLFSWEHFQKAD